MEGVGRCSLCSSEMGEEGKTEEWQRCKLGDGALNNKNSHTGSAWVIRAQVPAQVVVSGL